MDRELTELPPDVVRFIEEQIDTVPHLEALLLLWENRSSRWTVQQAAARLYVPAAAASSILDELVRRDFVQAETEEGKLYYRYQCPRDEQGEHVARVAAVYRRHTVQVASLIHSKASTAVRDFARAFRFRKD
jgi:predicted ArsR family transcriptional regulator